MWVVGLGPVINDGYEWTMLAYPNRLHLYIFARDVDDYFTLYENSTLGRSPVQPLFSEFNKKFHHIDKYLNYKKLTRETV